jgi:Domain of unknown function (DUF4091)
MILPGAKVTSFMFDPPWGSSVQSRDSTWYAAWKQEFQATGWYRRPTAEGGGIRAFDYTCDEPANGHCATGAYIPPRAASVHGLTPEFPVLVTNPVSTYEPAPIDGSATYCPDAQQNGDWLLALTAPSIDLAVANSNYVRDGADAGVWVNEVPTCSRISEVWWYQACDVHGCGDNSNGTVAHQPNIMVDVGCTNNLCGDSVSGAQNRAMQWFTYYYRFKGELYWDYIASFTLSDPWTSVWYVDAGGNGDGTLLYPWNQTKVGGTTPIPVPSLRLKILRDGMEDYEYLVQLDSLCPGEARTKVGQLFGTPMNTRAANVAVADLYRVRGEIADRIAALKANPSLCSSTPPPPPPPPAYCPADHPYDCCGDGSACMCVRSKCDVVQCG